MKQIIINGRVLGVVDVPEGAVDLSIRGNILSWRVWLYFGIIPSWDSFMLPARNWSILGRLNDITEEQAAGIVRIHDPKSYLTATLKLHGIEGNPLVLLLNDNV